MSTKEQLIAETYRGKVTKDDAFLLFSICHMYYIVTSYGGLAADTQRGSGDCLAHIWPDTSYIDWYWMWNTDWNGYDHFENLEECEKARLEVLIDMLRGHPTVESVMLEDE